MHSGRFSQARGRTDGTEVTQGKRAVVVASGFRPGEAGPWQWPQGAGLVFLGKMNLNYFWFGDMELSVSHSI